MLDKKVVRQFEIRAAKGDDFALVGRALSYNEISSSELAPGYRELLVPGCFRASLEKGDLVCLLNHDTKALPLGRQANKTLEISDSDEGLDFRCQLDKVNPAHVAVYASVKRGDIKGMSFGFICNDDDFIDAEFEGQPCKVRRVKSADIYECSVCTFPFYSGDATSVAARSKQQSGLNEFLAKILDMPKTWALQERSHQLGLEIARSAHAAEQRTADDDEISDEDFDAAQEALIAKYGRTRNGHAPAHWLVSMDSKRCRTLHMDSSVRCVVPFERRDDSDDFDFGSVEPDTDYCEPDDRAAKRLAEARQVFSDSELYDKMRVAAGRAH
jgi:HK97 family phage prohead protease